MKAMANVDNYLNGNLEIAFHRTVKDPVFEPARVENAEGPQLRQDPLQIPQLAGYDTAIFHLGEASTRNRHIPPWPSGRSVAKCQYTEV